MKYADGAPVAALPGITDVAAGDQGFLWAITGGSEDPTDSAAAKPYKVKDGVATEFADLGDFEAKYPHPAEVDSNPHRVADLGGGEALVADAGGNTLLKIDKHGKVKLVAVLPNELVSVDNAKSVVEEVVGASGAEVLADPGSLPEELREEAVGICSLPAMIPTETKATKPHDPN